MGRDPHTRLADVGAEAELVEEGETGELDPRQHLAFAPLRCELDHVGTLQAKKRALSTIIWKSWSPALPLLLFFQFFWLGEGGSVRLILT